MLTGGMGFLESRKLVAGLPAGPGSSYTSQRNGDTYRRLIGGTMKIRTVATVAIVLLAVFVSAPAVAAQESGAAPKEHSMTGCLQKGTEANTFQLTDLEKGPKTVEIVETTANLAPHVGHKVEITGTATKGKEGTHSMKITAVKMIAPTCP